MRHIATITKQQPGSAQTNFQVLLDGMLAILTTIFSGPGSFLSTWELAQRQRPFKTGGPGLIGDGDGNGDIGAGFF